MYIAALAWLCLALGYAARKDRRKHIPLMLTGILLDILLVLYLQLAREAIQTAASFELGWMPQVHIGFSSIALLLYFPVLYCGVQLWRGKASEKLRSLHIRLGITALMARTVGLIFMLSLL